MRKETKALKVVTIKKDSQDVQVPTGDAVETIQAKEIEADTVIIKCGGLTEASSRSDHQHVAGLTDPICRSDRRPAAGLTDSIGRSDRRLMAGLTGPRGRSDRGALEKSWRIESSTVAFTSTKNIKNHWLAPGKQPQPKWMPSGLSRSQKRRLQHLRAIGKKEKEAEDVENKTCNNSEPRTVSKQIWRPKEVKVKRPVISYSSDKSNFMREESSVIRDKSPSHDAMGVSAVFILPSKSRNQESRFCLGAKH